MEEEDNKDILSEEDRDIYTAEGIIDFFDNDEISAREEGFMRGYLGA